MVIRDLPTFLDFIIMSVEAGLNITGGIEQATVKGPDGPLNQGRSTACCATCVRAFRARRPCGA